MLLERPVMHTTGGILKYYRFSYPDKFRLSKYYYVITKHHYVYYVSFSPKHTNQIKKKKYSYSLFL